MILLIDRAQLKRTCGDFLSEVQKSHQATSYYAVVYTEIFKLLITNIVNLRDMAYRFYRQATNISNISVDKITKSLSARMDCTDSVW